MLWAREAVVRRPRRAAVRNVSCIVGDGGDGGRE